jgi:hypothetical protein
MIEFAVEVRLVYFAERDDLDARDLAEPDDELVATPAHNGAVDHVNRPRTTRQTRREVPRSIEKSYLNFRSLRLSDRHAITV